MIGQLYLFVSMSLHPFLCISDFFFKPITFFIFFVDMQIGTIYDYLSSGTVY